MPSRTAPLALLAVAACFVDIGSGGSNSDESGTGASTTGQPPATSSASSSAADADTTQGTVDPTTGPDPTTLTTEPTDPTTQTTDPTADPTHSTNPTTDPTDPSTSTSTNTTDPPGDVCGNGVVEPSEECDDGNRSDSDNCLSTCKPASCDDGIHNQSESDVDCGGPCVGCGPCSQCDGDGDCASGLACDGGLCNEIHQISVDYAANCSVDGSFFVPVDTVHGGVWRIEAVGGGGFFVYTEPQTFAWYIDCDNFDFTGLNVPQSYPSPAEAFDAVDPKFDIVAYAGGMTFCGIYDSNCDDNAGGADIVLYHACN